MPTKRAPAENAMAMLKADHQKVKELFDKFESARGSSKPKIVAAAIKELKVHATVEEELFYPTLRREIQDEEGIMEEADEEHHVGQTSRHSSY